MATRPAGSHVNAWRPLVAGVAEVFHAHFVDHAYPRHIHDVWTLLIVDDGAVRFDLDRHRHGALRTSVTLLPPYVPHDGSSATPGGFRKRVLYLDTSALGAELVGRAVDEPDLADPQLRDRIHHLHQVLAAPGDEFEAESRLALILERLRGQLRQRPPVEGQPAGPGLAVRLRELLDARTVEGVTLGEAAELLHAHPTHLVRTFTHVHGVPPHSYLTGRRVELVRRLLLAGQRPAEAAVAAGFFDQAHLTRHFRRYLGVSPARYLGGPVTGIRRAGRR
ncbi:MULTISPECIES: helix-turn-helix transcriptional regulator [Micromonospora]|uniref:AraC family transcriptional regulator n=1 Tax=Micromonospora zamorensis TaxID=709883 RepID=A0ABZ1PM42_9ACTN|nr:MULTISPECIES: AraC family transcriptional regulator [Micromonospora]MBQ0977314.1 AraC family transcriptional regulator [Micromonospora sp. M61]TQJ23126.1 AraC family transcriptional regulator [Micromonospora sp. A202]WSK49241.1 AraC family transcriptional regulator [Micromonospora zamorensis]WTI22821.1 AraC family transcriptional regulator [Micromonospora zamorensis]